MILIIYKTSVLSHLGGNGVLAVVKRGADVPEPVADGVGAGVVRQVLLDDRRDEARRELLAADGDDQVTEVHTAQHVLLVEGEGSGDCVELVVAHHAPQPKNLEDYGLASQHQSVRITSDHFPDLDRFSMEQFKISNSSNIRSMFFITYKGLSEFLT